MKHNKRGYTDTLVNNFKIMHHHFNLHFLSFIGGYNIIHQYNKHFYVYLPDNVFSYLIKQRIVPLATYISTCLSVNMLEEVVVETIVVSGWLVDIGLRVLAINFFVRL